MKPKPQNFAKRIAGMIFRELGLRKGESLNEFAQRTGQFVGTHFNNQLSRRLQDLFKIAVRDVSRETGVSLEFGPLDQRYVRSMLESNTYDAVFKDYSKDSIEEIKKVVFKATQQEMSYEDIQRELTERIDVIESRGRMIAQNEMSNVYKNARGLQYEKIDPDGDKYRYEWIGPDTDTTTEICKAIKSQTRGGVTREELHDIIRNVATGPLGMKGFDYMDDRRYQPHFSCRHHQRMIPTGS